MNHRRRPRGDNDECRRHHHHLGVGREKIEKEQDDEIYKSSSFQFFALIIDELQA